MKFNFLLIATILLIISIPVSAKQPAILHITFTDQLAIGTEDNLFVEKLYTQAFPEYKFIEVRVNVPKFLRWPTRVYRSRARKQLEAKIDAQDEITHMVVSTHGKTFKKNGEPITNLDIIGEISASGLDDRAKDFFQPVMGRFHPKTHIFFNSCKVFCGTKEEVGHNAETLLNDLGIPNGGVYGAEVSIASVLPPGHFSNIDLFFIRKPLFYLFSAASIFNMLVVYEIFNGEAISGPKELGFRVFTKLALISFGGVLITPAFKGISYLFHAVRQGIKLTTGNLIQLENGKVRSIEQIHHLREAALAYGVDPSSPNECVDLLTKISIPIHSKSN